MEDIIRPAFTPTKLQGEKKLDKVQIRMNKEDREIIEKLKQLIGNEMDAATFRISMHYTYNVLRRDFGGSVGVRLFKKNVKREGEFFLENE